MHRSYSLIQLTAIALFFATPFPAARADALANYAPNAAQLSASYARANAFAGAGGLVFKAQIAPHWYQNNSRFWYRNALRGGIGEFIVVDCERGKRERAFDHTKLAAELSKAAGKEYTGERLPFDSIEFVNDAKTVRFKVDDTTWQCDLGTYELTLTPCPSPTGRGERVGSFPFPGGRGAGGEGCDASAEFAQATARSADARELRSPDGKLTAFVKDHNLHLRTSDGKELKLTFDGEVNHYYGAMSWSPDSKTLVSFRIEPGDRKEVYLIESSPSAGGRAKLQSRPYDLPGDKFAAYEPWLFEAESGKATKAQVERVDFGFPRLRWKRDGSRFTYEQTDRGHQRFRVIEVDARTGAAQDIIDEKSDTFIWTAHGPGITLDYLDKSDEIIFKSERDGWWHLYLIDAVAGAVKNQITKGPWVMRGIDRIDEEKREIWFRASGMQPTQDPYFIHNYRINFDGTGLVVLTAANGNHTVQYSPDRKYLIDTYSRVDMAPVHELRRAPDGKLVCDLEKADTSVLVESGWKAPEVFVTKGRDGVTDIWGVVFRPAVLDPTKKSPGSFGYPIIENIYAGPHGSFVPKSFSAVNSMQSLAELGFIVVQCDGMGTANRSKAFHDVCWQNLADAGFPDRILWITALAAKYLYMDIDRVGIYGTSAGGQSSTGALLFHPEFYKVAVSSCGCHDNRMDKASWNEQWMGYPVGAHYAEQSNITNAKNLRGNLLLMVGEMDTNVPPESTLRLVDALIKAGKDFDFIMLPGMNHTNGGAYGERRRRDFFVRHLLGVEPPERNAEMK